MTGWVRSVRGVWHYVNQARKPGTYCGILGAAAVAALKVSMRPYPSIRTPCCLLCSHARHRGMPSKPEGSE